MATKPEAWQEQSPVNSLNNECWTQGEVGATSSHNKPLQDKKAPRAEPEEDIDRDVAEPGAQDAALQQGQTFTREKNDNATKVENRESGRIYVNIPVETKDAPTDLLRKKQSETLDLLNEFEESDVQSEDDFPPPPPPPLNDLSSEEYIDKDFFSSMEKDIAEIISDQKKSLILPYSQNSEEWPQLADWTLSSPAEEMTQDNMAAEKNDTLLNFLPDGFKNSGPENIPLEPAHHHLCGGNRSDDVNASCSPPFVDDSEEEEQVNMDMTAPEQQQSPPEITSQRSQASNSAVVLVSAEHDAALLPALSPTEQQEALLNQSLCEPAPRGGNQEAAQQVRSQSSPPLSAVSIEVSNQGGAASQACGCVVAPREKRRNRAGERIEGESEQTGGGEGQNEGVLEKSETGQGQSRGLLKADAYSCSVRLGRMESDSCDDSQSDSGVSADFSPCGTLEGNTTISTGSPPSAPKETPIEREIRRAIEREHSLRRSRGLPNPPRSPEYVDIPLKKTGLSQSLTPISEKHQGKDRQFAGKKMQHDIHRESQREQDLVKLGKVPGFYDKGTVRQLKDRKQIFEVFQMPSDSSSPVSARSKVTSWSSASDILTLGNDEVDSSQVSTIGGSNGERKESLDLLSPKQSNNVANKGGSTNMTPRGPGFSDATGCQVIILENSLSVPALKLYHAQQEAEHVTAVDSGKSYPSKLQSGREQDRDEEVEPKENPFFKLRPSTNLGKAELEIREAKEREKELRKHRTSGHRGPGAEKGEGGERPTIIKDKTPIMSPSTLNGLAASRSSSRVGTGTPAARQSVGKLGMWPPTQAEAENMTRPEVQNSRPPRKKTPLVHRWESGLINGHSQQDD